MMNVRVGIIGAGRVALSLALALQRLNSLQWIVVRSAERRAELRLAFDEELVSSSVSAIESMPDIIIVAVSDRAIRTVTEELVMHHGTALEGRFVLHCSGFEGVDILESVLTIGARPVAAHPFQTFSTAQEHLLNGISWGIECDAEHREYIGSFVRMLNGTPVFLSQYTRAHKALYHISAVMASNYVVTAIAAAQDSAVAAQLDPALLLQPIIRTTVENSFMAMARQGVPPLTGPIARGDISAVRVHIAALRELPELLRQYCHLGLATLDFAAAQGYVDDDTAILIREELQSQLQPQVG
jgi:predicted short-subunit dehydrogenase-like oxidoreductase (DUF2520 family)